MKLRNDKVREQPLVSVVVPVFNRENMIKRAVTSALSQSVASVEVLVVDDASTDGTVAAVESIEDDRVEVHSLSKQKGAPAARNYGLDRARGKYVALLDSDDEWLYDKLEKQVEAFETSHHRNVGAVLCDSYHAGSEKTWKGEGTGDVYEKALALEGVIPGGCGSQILLARDVVEAGFRFDEDLPSFQDVEFFFRVSKNWKVERVNEVLAVIHDERGDTEMHLSAGDRQVRGRLATIRKHREELEKHPRAMAHHLDALAGQEYYSRDNFSRSMFYMYASTKYEKRISKYTFYLSSFLGKRCFHFFTGIIRRVSSFFKCIGLTQKSISRFGGWR